MARPPTDPRQRFFALTRQEGDCLLWAGATNRKNGYGLFRFEGVLRLAHHVAWILGRGAHSSKDGVVPAGRERLGHTCGNRLCVRIEHLLILVSPDAARELERTARKEARRAALERERVARFGPLTKGGRVRRKSEEELAWEREHRRKEVFLDEEPKEREIRRHRREAARVRWANAGVEIRPADVCERERAIREMRGMARRLGLPPEDAEAYAELGLELRAESERESDEDAAE